MNGKQAKAIRKRIRKEAGAVTAHVFLEIMKWPLKERVKLAYRIIFKKFTIREKK